MNAIDLITSDHATVEQLFRSVEAGRSSGSAAQPVSNPSPADTATLVGTIVRELSIHAALEEQMVYPTLRLRVENGNALADAAIAEHQTVKNLLAQLEAMAPDGSGFDDTLAQLIANVRQHVQEEEAGILPQLRAKLSDQELELFGTLMGQAKGLMPTHPHPEIPGYATTQLLAGPWASIADRMRDFFEGLAPRRS